MTLATIDPNPACVTIVALVNDSSFYTTSTSMSADSNASNESEWLNRQYVQLPHWQTQDRFLPSANLRHIDAVPALHPGHPVRHHPTPATQIIRLIFAPIILYK